MPCGTYGSVGSVGGIGGKKAAGTGGTRANCYGRITGAVTRVMPAGAGAAGPQTKAVAGGKGAARCKAHQTTYRIRAIGPSIGNAGSVAGNNAGGSNALNTY